ncbi:hypothetical protein [uncultured Methylobacterium sp.]|uniref:hypothetical protein n=1 Tax=uncultured Methylobacterium sp. TaxID=157278 RepID=UPI002596E514|nr:hypothetical protein [uncultured Methylobacterium sp.]
MSEFPPPAPIDPDFIPDCMKERFPTLEEIVAIRERHRLAEVERVRLRDAPYVEAARTAARESLATQRWAWSCRRIIERAEALLAREDLPFYLAKELNQVTAKAAVTIRRAVQAATVPHEPELARAGDLSIREAAREGVAYLTRLDSDEARERNKVGWGKSTMVMGHVLDTLDEFSPSQASHALRILRTHRRQLPPILAARLFDGAQELPL